ncbi:MAG: peptidoglycan DD-metalloendopeptidase family protein [Dorea sp.]|nr:peptidoglycan DD-metalloendopeptidase family protein [Dorea sp.]
MMQRKRFISLLLVFILAFGMTVQVQASSIEETKKKGQELKSKKSSAEAEKAALADQLNTLIEEMDETTTKIAEKQEEIAEKETELIQAQIDENNQYESMKKRIKYMYENGNTQFIEILFESKSISDFLNNAEYITQISEYDRDMLDEFKETVKRVDDQKKVLESEKTELETLQAQLQEKQNEVSVLLEEKAEEISDLEAAIGENAAKLKALQEEAARQQRMREEAAAAAAAAAQQGNSSGGGTAGPSIPPSGNGTLSNPCPSAYISSEFGGRASPGGIGSTNHKGRDYAAGAGSPIYAAAGGTVTTVAYNGARGNYVVINHGNGLSTLYQHCSATYVSVGQSVSVGQNIAAVGSTGASTGPHLHFEVWVGGVPVDPRLHL